MPAQHAPSIFCPISVAPRDYDPRLLQGVISAVHVARTDPEVLAVLQCPRTASSGRRLIVASLGGSYFFLLSACFSSRSILPPVAPLGTCKRQASRWCYPWPHP